MTLRFSVFLLACVFPLLACNRPEPGLKTVSKNGLTVTWKYVEDRIYFDMQAPTDGWVAIGFNTGSGMTGAYLLMGRVTKGKAEVVEHYTTSPGNYKPITVHGAEAQVADVSGIEKGKNSQLSFSLPVNAMSKYQRDLSPGSNYTCILAFSRDDDFQHHSMMRTSAEVEL